MEGQIPILSFAYPRGVDEASLHKHYLISFIASSVP